jgi:SAM-dependent methyltransferase/phosphoglycolate phosphatase-like HAD superfamily hydrolase
MDGPAGRRLTLFDFDGTIVHLGTDYPRLRADLEQLAGGGNGGSIYDLSLRLAGDPRADEIVVAAELAGLEAGHELEAGVELYRRYAVAGAELAVVTHNSREVVEAFFDARELPEPVEIFDRRALGATKAESEALTEYVRDAGSIVVVGDSDFDRALAVRLEASFVDVNDELGTYYETRAHDLDELALTYEHPEAYKRFFYRARFKAVLGVLDPQPGEAILDVGCGSGAYTRELVRLGAKVTATEIAPTPLARAKRNLGDLAEQVDFRLDDAQALDLPDSAFDKVLLTEVIEHVPEPERAIAEAARVLRPGGVLVVSTPSRFSPMNLAYDVKRRVRRYGFNEHLHELTPESFRQLVGEQFEVERLEFANFLLPYPADELYRRLGSPAIALLKLTEKALSQAPVLRRLGWTMVIRARRR